LGIKPEHQFRIDERSRVVHPENPFEIFQCSLFIGLTDELQQSTLTVAEVDLFKREFITESIRSIGW